MSKKTAAVISIAAHPFVMVIILLISAADNLMKSFSSIIVVAAVVLIPITLFISRKVKSRAWENIDASNSSERPAFYIIIIILMLILNIIFISFTQFKSLAAGGIGILMLLVIHALLNFKIKASLHIAFAVYTIFILFFAGSVFAFLLLALLPFLIIARLELKRHNMPEIITGIITASVSFLIFVITQAAISF